MMIALHMVLNKNKSIQIIRLFLYGFFIVCPSLLFAQNGYYIPTPPVVPVHTEANQLHISAAISFGYNLSTSYTVNNHLALFATGSLANGAYRGMTITGSTFRKEKDDYSVTGGVGYLLSPTSSEGNVFELFIGAGKFKADNYRYSSRYESTGTETYAAYWSVFGQFNAVTKSKETEVGAAVRLAYNNYSRLSYALIDEHPYPLYSVRDLWSVNAEPVFSFSYIIQQVKLNAQVGVSWPLISGNNDIYKTDPYTQEESHSGTLTAGALIGSIGLQYNINFKKGKE